MPPSSPPKGAARPTFHMFYAGHFLAEHQHPLNIAAHVAGTIAGLTLMGAVLAGAIAPWWALAFPLVHAAPGLLGHRMFERNMAVGDTRLTRTDFPLYWFIIANHLMTARLLTGRR